MASSSTNKQPLLIDRVLHSLVDLNTAAVGAIDIAGTNTAVVVVDGTTGDGAIIEDIYALARGTTASTINLYMSRSNDYLRPNEAMYLGQFDSATTAGGRTEFKDMPKVLAPMPQWGESGMEQQFRALYLPKGMVLWAARESTASVTDGPLLGAQGGYY